MLITRLVPPTVHDLYLPIREKNMSNKAIIIKAKQFPNGFRLKQCNLCILMAMSVVMPAYAEVIETKQLDPQIKNNNQQIDKQDNRQNQKTENIPTVYFDPITVTARKYEETLAEVPFSVSVLSPQNNTSIHATHESAGMAKNVANLSLSEPEGTFSNTFILRGIGSIKPLSADDTAVSVYENGVSKSTVSAPASLFDAKRVEVLRGPQGTLFGRNSQGGSIHVISNEPQFEKSYKVGASVGNLNQKQVFLIANDRIGKGDKGAWRLATRYSKKEGNIENVATGEKDGDEKDYLIRGSVVWLLDDSTEVNVKGWSHHRNSNNPRYILKQASDFPKVSINPDDLSTWEDNGASLAMVKDINELTLTSLTSFESSTTSQNFDFTDGLIFSKLTPMPVSAFNIPKADFAFMEHKDKRWQQELRLAGETEQQSKWQIGTQIFASDFQNDHNATASKTAPMFSLQNGHQTSDIDTLSMAVFGEMQIPLNEKFGVNLGARVTNEHKDVTYGFVGNGHPAVVDQFSQEASLQDTLYSGRLGFSAKVAPEYMLYANVARGSSASGFPLYSPNLAKGKQVEAYPTSENWTYETGLKWQSENMNAMLNASLFYNDLSDSHLIVFDPKNAILTPAILDYSTYGAELEGIRQLTPNWSASASVGYTQTQLDDVNKSLLIGAKKGNHVPNVPSLSANIALDYDNPNGWNGQLSMQHTGKRSADIANSFDLSAYAEWNAKIGYRKNDWQAYLYANNLFDKQGYVAGQTWGKSNKVQSVRLNEPRMLGIGFEKQW